MTTPGGTHRPSGDSRLHLVVGASGKLGGAIVERLLAGGATVLGVARDRERLQRVVERAGGHLEMCVADVRSDEAVGRIRTAIGGRSVGMVVNAARPTATGGVLDVPPSAVTEAVDVKVGGLLRLVRAADDALVEGGRIVALGGRLGYDADPRAAAAGIANAAVANLVRQLAATYGPRGITAHVVAPGAVRGAGPDGSSASALGHVVSEAAQAEGTPLGRLPSPTDVAWAVELLLTPQAAFLNGGALILDGGRRTAIP